MRNSVGRVGLFIVSVGMTVRMSPRYFVRNIACRLNITTQECTRMTRLRFNGLGRLARQRSSLRRLRLAWESIKRMYDMYSTTLYRRVWRDIIRRLAEREEMENNRDVSCFGRGRTRPS